MFLLLPPIPTKQHSNLTCVSCLFVAHRITLTQAGDFLFRQMMDLTLREDKEIIENIYPEYQHGFMNARYDQQVRTGHQS